MPRTKVTKTSKRNREASYREEKVREFDASIDELEYKLDIKGGAQMKELEAGLSMLMSRTNKALLQMTMADFFELNLDRFSEYKQHSQLQASASASASFLRAGKASNPNDEGYLTEDSTTGGGAGSSSSSIGSSTFGTGGFTQIRPLQSHNYQQQQQQQQQQRGCTPGPLSSARLRRPRRSRSACGDYMPGSAIKAKPSSATATATASASASEHASRSKLRTPLVSRTKALSADRSMKVCNGANLPTSPQSPPTAFMRWPKPGEMVLSMCGTPVLAQVMPDKFANVNIPVRNGVLSLRPKKLSELKADILDGIDPETMNQIKTLHANLDLIMNMADKGANK